MTAATRGHKIWKPRSATRRAILGLYAGELVTWFLRPFAHGTESGAQYWLGLVLVFSIGGFVVWKTLSGSLWARKLTLIYSAVGALTAYQLLTFEPGRAMGWVLTAVGVVIAAITFWLVKKDTPSVGVLPVSRPESHGDTALTRRRSGSGWAIRFFAAAISAFLLSMVGIFFSGGGLSRGTLSEPMNGVAVAATWVALLAFVVLLPLAVLTGFVSIVRSWTAPNPAASFEDDRLREPPKRELGALIALVALTIAAAYLWSETGANRSREVMPFAIVVLGCSLVFAWLIIRTKQRP